MTTTRGVDDAATAEVIAAARDFAAVLRERALDAERARRVSDETMAGAEIFLSTLVPARWGGKGLGLRALCEVTRELARGDLSAAWVIAFMMQHNWMVARLASMDAQERLFADRPFVRVAAPLNPTGRAMRVEGGFRISGTYPYASGIWNADWTLLNAMLDEGGRVAPLVMMLPVSDLDIRDDWFMSGMASTGSASFTVEDAFVPENLTISFERLLSADDHNGLEHAESFYRYPMFAVLDHTSSSVALGCAEAAVDLVREKLPTSRALGQARLDRPTSRVRWGQAAQKVKCARLLWDASITRAIDLAELGEPFTAYDMGQFSLDCMTVVQLAQEAIGLLADGMGSSSYRLADPLQRYRRDIDVLANHRAHDRDTVSEAATRAILGLAAPEGDPFGGRAPAGGLQ